MIIRHLDNNDGHVMILALGMIVALSLTAFMAMDNSLTDSKIMRNNRLYKDNLYRSETGITVAMETEGTWLNPNSNLFNPDNSTGIPLTSAVLEIDADDDVKKHEVAKYRISRIESDSTEFYKLAHRAQPSVGSGFSPRNFEIRRYGIVSTGRRDSSSKHLVTVETGVSRIFNKPR